MKNRMTLPGCHGAITAAAAGAVGEAMAAATGRPTGAASLLTDAAGNVLVWGTPPSLRRFGASASSIIGSDTTGSLLSPEPGRDSAPVFGLAAAIVCPFRVLRPGGTAVTSTVRGLEFGGAETAPGIVEVALREPRSAVRVGPADPEALEEPVVRDGPVDPEAFEESVAPDVSADPEVSANADGIAARKEPTPRATARAPTRPT
jgi:hypothetical protein